MPTPSPTFVPTSLFDDEHEAVARDDELVAEGSPDVIVVVRLAVRLWTKASKPGLNEGPVVPRTNDELQHEKELSPCAQQKVFS
jgi:hypothetical protein